MIEPGDHLSASAQPSPLCRSGWLVPEKPMRVRLRGVGEGRGAAQFDLDSDDLDEALRAVELHDIGKLAIPDAILNCRSSLETIEQKALARRKRHG